MKPATTEDMLESSAASRTDRAGMLTVGSQLGAKLIDLVMLLFLARFSQPLDFGIVAVAVAVAVADADAVAMAVLFVVEAWFELPTAAAIIKVPEITPDLLNSDFTLS